MENKKVRVRFAPSPTGYLHIGGLRTALYNYLFAKKHNGDFILRIEDTDQSRKVEDALENLIETIKYMGLSFAEGPNTKGKVGPYIQSDRLDIYTKYAQELIDKDKAYYCFCTSDRLDEMRKNQEKKKQAPKYDRTCFSLTKEEAKYKIKNGEPYVIRFKMPDKGITQFTDVIRDKITVENKYLDDQVLIKSDGYPTYHLANIVDDHLMGITHVIRGEEWISSTPKHVLLYEAFNWDVPIFAHLPLILNEDKSKLSKRQGDVSVEDFITKGYIADALINYIALLGWNPKDDQEIYSLKELEDYFDLSKINKSGAVFDLDKLKWVNGQYIRRFSHAQLYNECFIYLEEIVNKDNEDFIKELVRLHQDRLETLKDITDHVKHYLTQPEYDPDLLIWKKSNVSNTIAHLQKMHSILEGMSEFHETHIEETIKSFIEKEALTNGEVLWPMRVALSGLKGSPGPFELAHVLGKEETLKRITHGIEAII